ncbi:MAG: ABC transporter ATP-binding protein [Chloroflexota bacterium]
MSLTLAGASYRYAGAAGPVLHDIDLVLEPGRVIGLVGPNGAGKSTLCLLAVGLAPRAIGGELTGRVTIDDLDTATSPSTQLAQLAGILFQEANNQLVSAAPSVWEEVAFGPRNLGLPLGEVVERTWAAIDALGIADISERDPSRLSGGQAQLVALAGVLALQPRYLVLDEPTSQLDPLGTTMVGDALAGLAQATGAGILIVEHKTDLLARLCHEVVVLDAGRIVVHGRADEILDDERLEGWGVLPPAHHRLRRAIESAGLDWPEASGASEAPTG